jgi:branched-chain amino acid transport system ATP-binding protein
MDSSPLLELKGVNKRFGGVITAHDVSFKVQPGTVHGLIGPNGAGKSTLMNLISGIYTADSGEIYLEGKEITSLPPYTRAQMGIGRTFQTPRFLQRSNIKDNLLLGTDLADKKGYLKSYFTKSNMTYEKDLKKYLEVVGFEVDLDNDITSLTYGQQKMLEIIRSLLSRPKIMLVDEPAAGLNNKEIENAMALINMAAHEYNIGILLIEHSMDMIMNICKEIVVLNFGKVIANGTPEEIARNKEVIAAYLGGGE